MPNAVVITANVKFIPDLQSCFVNLPHEYVYTILGGPEKAMSRGAVALELVPSSNNNTAASASPYYVGWAGGISSSQNDIEISLTFAQSINLNDHLVNIRVIEYTPHLPRITVEPVSYEDWQIIELHSEFVSSSLLSQLSVVYHNQKVPIWISTNTIVFVYISIGDEEGAFGKLSTDSLVCVSPKSKHHIITNSSSFRVDNSFTNLPHVALLHPSDFVSLDGVVALLEKECLPIVITLQSLEEEDNITNNKIVLSLMASNAVRKGHIKVHSDVFQSVFNASLNFQLCLVQVLLLPPTNNTTSSSSSSWYCEADNTDIPDKSMVHIVVGKSDDVVVVGNNSVVRVRRSDDDTTSSSFSARIVLDIDSAYILVSPDQEICFRYKKEEPSNNKTEIIKEAGMSSVLRKVNSLWHPSVVGFYNRGILLVGSEGTGKTCALQTILRHCRTTWSCYHTTLMDCSISKTKTREDLLDSLSQIFKNAARHHPSVIALDNIHVVIPALHESDTSDSEDSHEIALHLSNLILQAPKDVYVIASCTSEASIHQMMRPNNNNSGCSRSSSFTTSVSLDINNNVDRRLEILEDIHNRFMTPVDLKNVARGTSGYSIRDLETLVSRVYYQELLETSSNSRYLYEEVLKEFVPTSRRSAKLQYQQERIKWSDVGGLSQVKVSLKSILQLPTIYSKLYNASPINLPSGVLLYGPSGCGKTLLASAVATECGLGFISVKGPEILNKYIGASEEAVRDLFTRASAAAPCILFLDEIDSIAPARGGDHTGVTDRVVNQLLTFLDGVEGRSGVYVLGASSRPWMIDPALLRPGRLDKSLYCGFPDSQERLEILMASNIEMTPDATDQLRVLASAQGTAGFTGADLQALLSTAQLEAINDAVEKTLDVVVVNTSHLSKALEQTRPSVSWQERMRMEKQYSDFTSKAIVVDTDTIKEQRSTLA